MVTDEPAPSAARRSERSRRAILSAAIELLGEVGYAKLTIEAIAARAGAGKQTIYRWWPSKSAVIFDAFRQVNDSPQQVAFPDSGDLAADLYPVMRAIVDECNDPKYDVPARVMIAESQYDVELAENMAQFMLRPAMKATEDRLRSAQRIGQLRTDADLTVAVELLFGPVYHRWINRTAPLDHAMADTIVDYVIRALSC
jgi:AcrR family transcriptional regulator